MDKRERPGIIYIGNLPYGFYEENLRKFLSEFGEVTKLKLKRSDKNAKPMGYAYVEFGYRKVATIAANTLNHYLMFSKLLKCHLVNGDSQKIFRKSNLQAEFCSGTRHKRRNQYKLENVTEEKVLKRLKQSKSKLSKVLGVKIGPRFLIQNSKNENSANKNVEPLGGELNDKVVSQEGKHSSHDTIPVTKKKQKIEIKATEKEDITNLRETPNSRSKALKKKNSDRVISQTEETPIYMDIEDEDDEIQFKTPPNVIKRYKKSVKIGSLKKKILGSNKANKSAKMNDLSTSKNSKKLKKTSMKIKKNGNRLEPDAADKIVKYKVAKDSESAGKIAKNKIVNKSDSSKTSKNKIGKKSSIKSQELKENKCSNVSQSNEQSTECISPNIPGKFVKQKRKAESVKDELTFNSKKLKLNSKKIKEGRNQKPEATDKVVKNKIAKESESTGKIAKNKIGKKSSKKGQESKANKGSNVSYSSDQGTEGVSLKVPGKFVKQKRKTESVKDEQTVKSKKFKLNNKKITELRNPNSKSQVKLVSFKKKTVKA